MTAPDVYQTRGYGDYHRRLTALLFANHRVRSSPNDQRLRYHRRNPTVNDPVNPVNLVPSHIQSRLPSC